jgi:glycosyltransferase involved in cell wall biosynthesis
MPSASLRVAFVGGVPPSLGGGGLELQMGRTHAALERRGHDVFPVEAAPEPRTFDVLHAFGSEPDVWHALSHWRRNPAPLVVSPVIVTRPGLEERLLRLGARVPLRSLAQRMRAEVVRRADIAIALTEHEARVVRAIGAGRIRVIGNGVDAADAVGPDVGGPEAPYVLLLGSVSVRKRQAETVSALSRGLVTTVIAGGFEGSATERADFEQAVARAGATWLGEVEPERARTLVRHARALVHLSSAEGQSLAMLEALAEGTPVIAWALPSNRELAARFPAHVTVVDAVDSLADAVRALPADPGPAPSVPTWDAVAGELEAIYRELTAA